jgi:hypothetical protein
VVNRWLFVHGFGAATINGGAVDSRRCGLFRRSAFVLEPYWNDLVGLHVAAHVKLHRLVDGLVFLFYVPVTSLKLGEAPPRAARKWSRPDSYADSCSVGRPRRVRCRTDYREAVRITRTQIRWQPRKTCNSKRFETFAGSARRVPPCICRRPPGNRDEGSSGAQGEPRF